MKVLLTGGAGYIGSHTAIALIARGHEVVIFDDLSNSGIESVRRVEELTGQSIEFEKVDLCDLTATRIAFGRVTGIQAVIHFAGFKSVGESVSRPIAYYANNLGSTLALLQVMKEQSISRLIFSSSATVYGDPERLPSQEDDKVGVYLANPYGRTKAMGEDILRDAANADGELAIAALRYFNPVGAHESGRIGEDPNHIPNNLMPFVSQVAVGQRDVVLVFGDDYDTPDGTGVRDYVHVMDLAEGHVAALERVLPGFEVFNLGTGRGTSVLELIDIFSQASGREIPYEIVARRPGDVAVSYADVRKASTRLGWAATRTVRDASRDAWAWQSGNPQGYSGKPA